MRRLRGALAARAAATFFAGLVITDARAQTGSNEMPVDVELVLAVDVSMSMDQIEQSLQREGYVRGLVDPMVISAIERGAHGRIAVTYVEWAGTETQRTVVDWMLIDGEDAARELSDMLAELPIHRARRTSIANGIDYAARLFDENGFKGLRKVIDVSGDGPNNQGRRVDLARDRALDKGIVINGLPFVSQGPTSLFDLPNLDEYYADCVIGGPGAFLLPVYSADEFVEAIRNKLVMEIAGTTDAEEIVGPGLMLAEDGGVACDIGERLWERFMGTPG